MPAPFIAALFIVTLGSMLALRGGPRLRAASLLSPLLALAVVLGSGHHADTGWWRVDALGATLVVVAVSIGLCATRYTLRQFARERRAGPILAASLLVVSSVVATDLAATTAALVLSWVATSAATILLLRAGVGSWRSPAVRSAGLIFAAADGLFLGAFLLSSALPGHAGLAAGLDANSGITGAAASVLLVGAVCAAVGRAGLSTRRSWVTATISTPTSISALLHAGVVNAGALLLLRLESAGVARWWASVTLAATCIAVLVMLAPRIHARVDLKGQLAASTVSQMSFMLLAVALGWPLLAITHLVGHGLYKAGRFMSSGGAIDARARRRRRVAAGSELDVTARVLGAVGLLGIAGLAGLPSGGDGLAAVAIMGPGAAVVWWARTSHPVRQPIGIWFALAASLGLYLGVLVVAHALLGASMPEMGWQAPWWSLGACLIVVATITSLRRREGPLPTGRLEVTDQRALAEVAA